MKKILLVVFALVGFITASQAQEDSKDTFPPTFGKGKTYLYVVTIPGYFQVNNALKKSLEKNYNGDYEVIDIRDFATVKPKSNINVYVFEMIYDNQPGYFKDGGAGPRVGPVTNYSCGVTDYSTKVLYRLPYIGGSYKKVMDKYIKRLEEIRAVNAESK